MNLTSTGVCSHHEVLHNDGGKPHAIVVVKIVPLVLGGTPIYLCVDIEDGVSAGLGHPCREGRAGG